MKYIVKYKLNFFLLVGIVLSISLVLYLSCDEPVNGYTGPWQEVKVPEGVNQLNACHFNLPNDGWACTGFYSSDSERVIFLHWNGSIWEKYEYPGWFDDEEYIAVGLTDIYFNSPDDGWAVGAVTYKLTGEDRSSGFILKYDGTNWYVFEKHIGEGVGSVFAISEDDVWFEAWDVYGNSNSDLYHWNGVELEFVNLTPGNYGISAIAFGSTNEGLAVGYYQFVYHWDGVSWDLITYGAGGEYSCVAYDTPTTAFIGGDNLARWENGEYHRDYDFYGTYNGIHFSHPDEGWMYGGEPTEDKPQGEGFFWYWDGVEWTRSNPPPFIAPKAVFSIDYDDAWMVGMGWNASGGSARYVENNLK